jgi:PST family polysaccharide transporter
MPETTLPPPCCDWIDRGALRKAAGAGFLHDLGALYAVQFTSYLVPLLTVPYLARVLGAQGLGLVAFAQAFCGYTALVGEYGFDLSATREIARARGNRTRLAEILGGVVGAKGLLMLAGTAPVLAAWWLVPTFRTHPRWLWAGWLGALGQAADMLWFFRGIEQVRVAGSLNVAGRMLAVAAIYLAVGTAADGWKVPALFGIFGLVSNAIALAVACRFVRARIPTMRSVHEALSLGWNVFLLRCSVSLYASSNAFILGLFAAPQVVGFYSGAERMSRALQGLMSPVAQAIYPRISNVARRSPAQAAAIVRVSALTMGLGAAMLGAAAFAAAPILVRVALGDGFEQAVPMVRVMASLPLLVALSNVLGIQWMLPLGLERLFNRIILAAGVLNLLAAVVLARSYGGLGAAWSVVMAETLVTAGAYATLRARGLDPFSFTLVASGQLPGAGAAAIAAAQS